MAALLRRIAPDRAARVALLRDIARRLLQLPLKVRPLLAAWSDVADYLRAVLRGLPREHFRVLFLEHRNRLIRVHLTAKPGPMMVAGSIDDGGPWRELFARALHEREVDAEATPRRARGVTRKAERGRLRRMRERNAAVGGAVAHLARGALADAVAFAVEDRPRPTAWEVRTMRRLATIRVAYPAQAELVARSRHAEDRVLAAAVWDSVAEMPAPDTPRVALARALQARDAGRSGPPPPTSHGNGSLARRRAASVQCGV